MKALKSPSTWYAFASYQLNQTPMFENYGKNPYKASGRKKGCGRAGT